MSHYDGPDWDIRDLDMLAKHMKNGDRFAIVMVLKRQRQLVQSF